jgi:hypothetical protein
MSDAWTDEAYAKDMTYEAKHPRCYIIPAMALPDPWSRHPLPKTPGACPETDPARARTWWALQHVKAAGNGHKLERSTLERATMQWLAGDWEKAVRTVAYAVDIDAREAVAAMAPPENYEYYGEDPEDDNDAEVDADGADLDDGAIDW